MSLAMPETPCGPLSRHATVGVRVGDGDGAVTVGGGAPIVVQSMTNTDTADIEATTRQIAALARAGSELVRLTVDRDEAAAAVPHIRDRLRARGITAPLIGDFHYIGHKLLAEHPACAEALDKYRINPGNVGFKNKRDLQFSKIIEIAIRNDKTVRIGANWGSLDQDLLDDAHGRECGEREAARGRRRHARGDGPVGASVGGAGGGDRAQARSHHPVGESVVGSGPHHRLSHAWATL